MQTSSETSCTVADIQFPVSSLSQLDQVWEPLSFSSAAFSAQTKQNEIKHLGENRCLLF